MNFVAFLIGTLLLSSLALLALLLAPQPLEGVRAERRPLLGAVIATFLVALGFIGGFAVAG